MWPEAIVSWILAAAFVGFLAGRMGRSQPTWTVLCLFLSPMIGLITLVVIGDAPSASESAASSASSGQRQRKCLNHDGQLFPSDRATCPLCGNTIDAGDGVHPRVR